MGLTKGTAWTSSFIAALTLLIVVPATAAAAPGKTNSSTLPTPRQVADPANWTVTDVIGQVRAISPGEAYAAMQQAGAANTTVIPGLSLRQAVGLNPVPAAMIAQLDGGAATKPASASGAAAGSLASISPAASVSCWASTVSRTWSFWPLQMTLADDAYWCGYYNFSITSFSHNVREDTGAGSYCGPAGTSWSPVYGFWSGSPIREYDDYGTWNCMGVYQSHSYQANVSSSGAHWIS